MRTEQLLREAMDDLAATARTPEVALPRVLTALPTRSARHSVRARRRVLVVALAAVLVVAAVTVPGLVRRGTAEPADTRTYGNWNLIHRVDLPAGWQPALQTVTGTSETSAYRMAPGASPGWQCQVEVRAAGQPLPDVIDREPVSVNGVSGYYGTRPEDDSGRLYWPYATDSWAIVGCSVGPDEDPLPAPDGRAQELEIARRVVFEPTDVRVAFRLRALPAGYLVHDVVGGRDVDGTVRSGVVLTGTDAAEDRPAVYVTVSPGTTELKPGIPGQETTTLDGRPAVLSATDGSLCLNVRGYTACAAAGGGEPADVSVSLWPAGLRELLLDVADHLELAKHLDDPSSWPDANEALPR